MSILSPNVLQPIAGPLSHTPFSLLSIQLLTLGINFQGAKSTPVNSDHGLQMQSGLYLAMAQSHQEDSWTLF